MINKELSLREHLIVFKEQLQFKLDEFSKNISKNNVKFKLEKYLKVRI